MFWYFVPAGALLAGVVGASGYYAGARFFNHRPTALLLVNILLASVGTFFLIHFLAYATTDIQGKPLSELFSFARYLDIATRSTSMQYRFHSRPVGESGALGSWGYAVAALQILGFAAGGLLAYYYLKCVPYCEPCSRYFTAKGKQTRYATNKHELGETADQILGDLRGEEYAAAIERHEKSGSPKRHRKCMLRSSIEVRACKNCGRHWVKYKVEQVSGNDWKEIEGLTSTSFTNQVVSL